MIFEVLAVVIMPFCDFNIKDIIVKIFDILKVLNKVPLEFHQVLGVLWTLNTTKDRNQSVVTFESKLKLSFTDFNKILASLDECLILSEDGFISVKLPTFFWRIFFEHVLVMNADSFPLFTAVNAFVKIRNTFFNIAIKHIVFVDFSSASLDDLVGDLGQETLHSLRCIVVLAQFPNDSHIVQCFREDLWNIFRAALFNLSARLRQHAKVLQVILSFIVSSLDFLLKLNEAWKIRA